MANIKITDLTAYTDAASTDVLPIVDVGADVTKKIAIGDILKAVPQGTAALPGLAFDGDPNTGLFSAGADQVAISTNGTERMRLDSSGRLGLGTSSPGYPLQVSGSTPSIAVVDSGANGARALIEATNSAVYYGSTYASSGIPTIFSQAGASGGIERMRIDSSGLLLVGTSSDSGGALLQVNDNRIRIATAKTPSSASDTGTAGEICWDSSYIYVCTATDTWKRAALSTW
jgi:hypothetical protein